MKLLFSALLLAASAAAAQTPDLQATPLPPGINAADQSGCPLALTGASLTSAHAGVLPIRSNADNAGSLDLGFRNQSGKQIRSVSVTAHLRVKTDVYALDATPVDMRLTFSGTDDTDRKADQLTHISLPGRAWLFGVAQVSLDQVIFADGNLWTAPTSSVCRTNGPGSLRIQAR